MSRLTDFHTHILPQVDDGSTSVEMSLRMLQMEAEQGIRTVVLTPHFYPQQDSPGRFLKRRTEAEQRLREALLRCELSMELHLGAEVAFYRGMSESEALQNLRIADSKYILVEMPMSSWTDATYEELYQIKSRQGLTPILAHIDRYLGPFQVNRVMDRLAELPVLLQANSSFFLRRSTARTALRLVKEGRIHLLGSDCHNLDTRAPNLRTAADHITAHLGASALRQIAEQGQNVFGTL